MPLETLITLILFILLSSAWIFGVHVLFEEGMILEKLGIWFDENLSIWLNKPLWKCPICMASVHGTTIYLFIYVGVGVPHHSLTMWVPFCVMLAGFNYVVLNLFRE